MPEGIVDIQKLIVVPEQQSFEFLNAHVSAISPLLEMTCSMPGGKNPRVTLKQHTYISTKLVSCPNQQTSVFLHLASSQLCVSAAIIRYITNLFQMNV
jgi:hypothetical protein